MAYDDGLAERVREALGAEPGLREKAMFGGLAFLINGNMAIGITGDDLMVRVGSAVYAAALARPHARVFDMTGRPMTGWVLVESEGLDDDDAFAGWVGDGVRFVRSLPAK